MSRRDSLGRNRAPDQERGLRPLHPVLPREWTSKALRIAMSEEDWARFDALAARVATSSNAPTQARAYGATISRLMRDLPEAATRPLDWLDWEREKTLRLLRARH